MQNELTPLAAIDMGSNTLRLACAKSLQNDKKRLHIFLRKRFIVRLAEGFGEERILMPNAINRTLVALRGMLSLLKAKDIGNIIVLSTGVIREAKNQRVFIDLIKGKLGINVIVLSGEEEARLGLIGIDVTIKGLSTPLLICDIGGGSTEFAIKSRKNSPKFFSLPLGVVRIVEVLNLKAPLNDRDEEALIEYIDKRLDNGIFDFEGIKTCVATAGTATTLASIDLSLNTYSPSDIHGHRMSLERIREIFHFLASKDIPERRDVAGLEQGREDIIIPGIAILICIMARIDLNELIISDAGLLEGVLSEEYKRHFNVLPEIII